MQLLLQSLSVVISGLFLCTAGSAFAQERAEIPDAAAQAEARKLIEEVYPDFVNAKGGDEQVAAARVLIMRAGETQNAPAAKYVMYDIAISLAVDAGDARAVMDAIEGLSASYKGADAGGAVDFLELASSSLQEVSRRVNVESRHAAVAKAGMSVAELMISADRLDEAFKILSRLRNSAVRSKRPELINAYKAMSEELRIIRTESQRIADELIAFKKDPDDPELSLTVGKFLTAFRGDWAAGLPILAEASDKVLADLAKSDLAGASEAKDQIAIGDKWWALASEGVWIERRNYIKRARYWYGLALPNSSGLERALLTKRLSPIGAVKWGDLVLEPGIRTLIELPGDKAGERPVQIVKEAVWEFREKPAGEKGVLKLHFEGYLYAPHSSEVGLKVHAGYSNISIEVNGRPVVSGTLISEAPVQMVKGYNAVKGTIEVYMSYIDDPDVLPRVAISLTNSDGKETSIPAEHWFHDITQ